ncbi:non-structural maintenance of chromosomes element 3 homolog [Asterias rubens]|uniref:non-structural maintenance of chromosomes element 3 homolog n=1 Tax=Asterias rubens TaxID=7604 RepID=UPI0014551EEB|nr:non-structural maintenance of chromosomes element 3 homolog [Asterias rubens]
MPRGAAGASQSQRQKSQPKKGRQKGRAAVVESSSASSSGEEDMDASQSQQQTQSMTQAERAVAKLTPELIERKVGELVQYMLIMEQKKIPIKRGDITKHVLKAEYRKILPHVLDRTKRKLKMAFGLDLVELVHKTGKSSTKMYILLNRIETEAQGDFIDSSSEDPKVGLLLVILSLIFMNGGVLTEVVLWHTLEKLGLRQEEKNHELFGDLKKLVTSEFASKQLYLDYSKIPNTDPALYQFKWGLRANAEVTMRSVLEFVCKMYGDNTEMSTWKEQYREVLHSERSGSQTDEDEESASGSDESDESD